MNCKKIRQTYGGTSISEIAKELGWDYHEFYSAVETGLFPEPSNLFGRRRYYTAEQLTEIRRIVNIGSKIQKRVSE